MKISDAQCRAQYRDRSYLRRPERSATLTIAFRHPLPRRRTACIENIRPVMLATIRSRRVKTITTMGSMMVTAFASSGSTVMVAISTQLLRREMN